MIIRIVDGNNFLGDIEGNNLPQVGDTVWVGLNGPYDVVDRTFHFERVDSDEHVH